MLNDNARNTRASRLSDHVIVIGNRTVSVGGSAFRVPDLDTPVGQTKSRQLPLDETRKLFPRNVSLGISPRRVVGVVHFTPMTCAVGGIVVNAHENTSAGINGTLHPFGKLYALILVSRHDNLNPGICLQLLLASHSYFPIDILLVHSIACRARVIPAMTRIQSNNERLGGWQRCTIRRGSRHECHSLNHAGRSGGRIGAQRRLCILERHSNIALLLHDARVIQAIHRNGDVRTIRSHLKFRPRRVTHDERRAFRRERNFIDNVFAL